MRPTHKNRSRSRHRSTGSSGSGGSGGGGNPLSRVYESNGPDVKVRGTAQTVADKYLQLGRDAQSAGDIIMAESYFQFAEHYLRIVSAAQAYNQQSQQQYRRPDDEFDDEELEDGPESQASDQRGGDLEGMGDQPMIEGANPPQPVQAPQQGQPYRQQRDYRDNNQRDNGQRDNNQRDNGQRDNNPNQRDNGQRDNNQRDNGQRDNNPNQRDGGQRDQNAAPNQNRDRFKPRWQDRKPEGQQAQPGEPRQNNQPSQPQPRQESRGEQRRDEQPRVIEAQPAPAPAAEADPQWEAPSFLRRPAPAPAVEAEEIHAPAVAEAAPAAPAKRKYERKPRKEPVAAAPPVTEPAAD